jgi:hypothetical protein
MLATNHLVTGALVAATVQQPALAIPAAFTSHFVLDALPHYGYGDIAREHRDQKKFFVLKQTIDIYFGLAMMWLLAFALRNRQSPTVTVLCMLVAFIPDGVWAFHYVVAQRSGLYHELNAFNRFHKSIQWCERQWGIYVEAVWFLGVILTLRALA